MLTSNKPTASQAKNPVLGHGDDGDISERAHSSNAAGGDFEYDQLQEDDEIEEAFESSDYDSNGDYGYQSPNSSDDEEDCNNAHYHRYYYFDYY
ncbi:hypothetical protein FA15DRAFT_701888 [Coprinopsis marcescibilis]|uniref:Uncharacterized protein n=1 Tax=Coprinopsis marcescibilis TaxID=230819 RepID=A0A5C3L432_COPMA|nr:hypothetical protein FA15DRAFT_701888 [Coprinopsis marcescibilis]